MASTTETGHAKNVANFKTLLSFCKGYGNKYNPSRPALTIKQLEALLEAATATLKEVKDTKTTFDNTTNSRRVAFDELKSFSTSVLKTFSANDVPAQAVADARGHNRKIQGKRAKEIKKTDAPQEPLTEAQEEKHISVSQQSFDSILDNFEELVKTVTAQPNYQPNEPELSTDGLNTKVAELTNLNDNVVNAFTGWSNARISRNQTLYSPLAGLKYI